MCLSASLYGFSITSIENIKYVFYRISLEVEKKEELKSYQTSGGGRRKMSRKNIRTMKINCQSSLTFNFFLACCDRFFFWCSLPWYKSSLLNAYILFIRFPKTLLTVSAFVGYKYSDKPFNTHSIFRQKWFRCFYIYISMFRQLFHLFHL